MWLFPVGEESCRLLLRDEMVPDRYCHIPSLLYALKKDYRHGLERNLKKGHRVSDVITTVLSRPYNIRDARCKEHLKIF